GHDDEGGREICRWRIAMPGAVHDALQPFPRDGPVDRAVKRALLAVASEDEFHSGKATCHQQPRRLDQDLVAAGLARLYRQEHDLLVRRDLPMPPHRLNPGWRHRVWRKNPAIDPLMNDNDFPRHRSMEPGREIRRET